MAQLKDLIVNGATRLIGNAYAGTIQITTINAPTSSSGTTTFGPGTAGYSLKTNGTNIYWGEVVTTDTNVTQEAAITTNGNYPIILAYSTATTTATNTVNKTDTLYYNPSTKVLTINGGTVVCTTFSGTFSGTASKVSSALTIGSLTYDGSSAVTIDIYGGSITNH